MADVEPLLHLRGVCKSFGGIQAVHSISLRRGARRERRPGRARTVPARRPCSTASAASCGPRRATSSSTGTPLVGLPTYKRARMGIGRTYQRVEVFTDMSVRDHLMVAERARQGEGRLWRDLLNLSKPKPDEIERVEATLELVGISHLADTSVNALGLGHCRLVELARALAAEPKILLADEPSSGLDLHETAEVAAVLRTVQRERGTAVLLVEHDLTMVAEVVDRAVVMDLGAMLVEGTFDEVHGRPGRARRLPGSDGAWRDAPSTRTPPAGDGRPLGPQRQRRLRALPRPLRRVVPRARRGHRRPGRLQRRRQVHRGPDGDRTGHRRRRARSSSRGRT